MKYKIALLYLNVSNLGDVIIGETAHYIIEDILKKHGIQDCEIVPVDCGSYYSEALDKESTTLYRIRKKLISSDTRRKAIYKHFPNYTKRILKKNWQKLKVCRYFMANEIHKLYDADLIVFAGGGLIKFHKQYFHMIIDEITALADERNIPVIFNAQGVEGYDEDDPACLILKNAINRKCVKYISTRDDFAMLQNCYFDNNSDIGVGHVCDPALWIKETYNIDKSNNNSKIIGFNLIRNGIFGEYLYDFDTEKIADLYYKIIKRIYENGYRAVLFGNGVETDYILVDILKNQYPELFDKYGTTVARPTNTRELVTLIASFDRFVAIRLHASIVGTTLGIPNVSLVWNRKQLLFGEEVGHPENYLTINNFNAEKIYDRLMSANPITINDEYKMSVYCSLEEQILRQIAIRKGKNE